MVFPERYRYLADIVFVVIETRLEPERGLEVQERAEKFASLHPKS